MHTTAMNARDAKWERTRAGGRTRFVLLYGVFLFGLGSGVLTWLLMGVLGVVVPSLALQVWSSLSVSLILLTSFLVTGTLSGWFWGRWMWNLSEERYRRLHTRSV